MSISTKSCSRCNKSFNFLTLHKYHCYACGLSFCHNCANNHCVLQADYLLPPATMAAVKDVTKAQRTCSACHERISTLLHGSNAPAVGKTIQERYNFGKVLGEGGFGVVKESFSVSDNSRVAVKIMKREKLSPDDEVSIYQEARILQELNHPNIVKMFDFYEEPENFYMVMECIDGGELFDRIVKKTVYTEKEARDLVVVCLNAIKFMHDRNIVHR